MIYNKNNTILYQRQPKINPFLKYTGFVFFSFSIDMLFSALLLKHNNLFYIILLFFLPCLPIFCVSYIKALYYKKQNKQNKAIPCSWIIIHSHDDIILNHVIFSFMDQEEKLVHYILNHWQNPDAIRKYINNNLGHNSPRFYQSAQFRFPLLFSRQACQSIFIENVHYFNLSFYSYHSLTTTHLNLYDDELFMQNHPWHSFPSNWINYWIKFKTMLYPMPYEHKTFQILKTNEYTIQHQQYNIFNEKEVFSLFKKIFQNQGINNENMYYKYAELIEAYSLLNKKMALKYNNTGYYKQIIENQKLYSFIEGKHLFKSIKQNTNQKLIQSNNKTIL